jgi:hypothetical protein
MPRDFKLITAWREFRQTRCEQQRAVWGGGETAAAVDASREERLVRDLTRAGATLDEQAVVFRRLLDVCGCTARELASFFDIGPATIVRALSLLEIPAALPTARRRKRGGRGKRAA